MKKTKFEKHYNRQTDEWNRIVFRDEPAEKEIWKICIPNRGTDR